jgi:hypothetical protein
VEARGEAPQFIEGLRREPPLVGHGEPVLVQCGRQPGGAVEVSAVRRELVRQDHPERE